tara:strand:+ start:529 stop:1590 length:1062 start_codon:yes stop_codon:yes gene_type:complete
MISDAEWEDPEYEGFAQTQLEQQGLTLETGAPVTKSLSVGNFVVAGFGDGTLRFFYPEEQVTVVKAHGGPILDLAADEATGNVLTGGDDGRFLQVSSDGTVKEIATFGTKWVDCVAVGKDYFSCSSERTAYVWQADRIDSKTFDHPSTVGGLAFDAKGRRLAVAHYGGATIWERTNHRWKSSKLVWKGSHGATIFSPDGKYLVTTMQENAMHGWHLRDKAEMRMAGYPGKVKSFTWVGDAPYLATSGSVEAICWPFDGKHGPMDREPHTCAGVGSQQCTAVTGLVGYNSVFAGFADGSVLAGQISAENDQEDFVVKGSSGVPIATLALTQQGWLFIGDEAGRVLWLRLGGDES